jgi:hypothetical protein
MLRLTGDFCLLLAAYMKLDSPAAAQLAVSAMNNQVVEGKNLQVRMADADAEYGAFFRALLCSSTRPSYSPGHLQLC